MEMQHLAYLLAMAVGIVSSGLASSLWEIATEENLQLGDLIDPAPTILTPLRVLAIVLSAPMIVLVDALSALNAGPAAVADLKQALADVLACFRIGENSLLSELFGKRVERVLFAATKADLLHHADHDRLENVLRSLIAEAANRAELTGAAHDVAALASIRATREAKLKQKNEELACIVGIPESGETIAGIVFDGTKEAAIFPGDLPQDAARALDGSLTGKLHYVRFRPPNLKENTFPHIRLDRTIEFLMGDRFA